MESRPDPLPRLRRAGGLFGATLGVSLAWFSYIYPFFALRSAPIDPLSFNLHTDAVVIATTVTLIGATLGGYLVARFWDRLGLALLVGGGVTAIVQNVSAYFMTTASLVNNQYAELIWIGLPLGILFGLVLAFIGGLLGSAFERLVLAGAAALFRRRSRLALLAWALALCGGLLLGIVASGGGAKREQPIAGALALHTAIGIAAGENVPDDARPAGFQVSDLALGSLRQLGARIHEPYVITLGEYDGLEVVTDAHFQDGFTMRCVSKGAYITRCFEQ